MSKKKKDIKAQVKSHVKAISTLVIGYGVGELMGTVMKDFKPDAKGIRKMFIKIGAVALTGMVIKSVTDYVEGEIDDIFNTVEEFMIEVEKQDKEDIGQDDVVEVEQDGASD